MDVTHKLDSYVMLVSFALTYLKKNKVDFDDSKCAKFV